MHTVYIKSQVIQIHELTYLFQRLVVILRETIYFVAQQPLVGQGVRIIEASLSHSDAPHTVGLLCTSDQPVQRPMCDITQHPQKRDSHVPSGIRTCNPSRRAAADPRLRPRGLCDRWETLIPSNIKLIHPISIYTVLKINVGCCKCKGVYAVGTDTDIFFIKVHGCATVYIVCVYMHTNI